MPFQYKRNAQDQDWKPANTGIMDDKIVDAGLDIAEAHQRMQQGEILMLRGRLGVYRWTNDVEAYHDDFVG